MPFASAGTGFSVAQIIHTVGGGESVHVSRISCTLYPLFLCGSSYFPGEVCTFTSFYAHFPVIDLGSPSARNPGPSGRKTEKCLSPPPGRGFPSHRLTMPWGERKVCTFFGFRAHFPHCFYAVAAISPGKYARLLRFMHTFRWGVLL